MPPRTILDPQLGPTYKPTKAQVREAMDALQIKGYPGMSHEELLETAVVAIVKHLMRGGFVLVEDEPGKRRGPK